MLKKYLSGIMGENEKKGQILITNEVMPVFSSTPPATNKTLHFIKKVSKDGLTVSGCSLKFHGNFLDEFFYKKEKVLTQNAIPIKTKDAFLKKLTSDNNFEKEGFKKGQIYSFINLGYLDNVSRDMIVHCVTDQLVIFKGFGKGNNLSFYNYKELKEMQDYRKLKKREECFAY